MIGNSIYIYISILNKFKIFSIEFISGKLFNHRNIIKNNNISLINYKLLNIIYYYAYVIIKYINNL